MMIFVRLGSFLCPGKLPSITVVRLRSLLSEFFQTRLSPVFLPLTLYLLVDTDRPDINHEIFYVFVQTFVSMMFGLTHFNNFVP